MESSGFNKGKLRFLGGIILFLLLAYLLIDNLTFIKNIKEDDLKDYAKANIRLENTDSKGEDPIFLLEESLDFAKVTVFKTQSSYVVSFFRKGRLSNNYNLEDKYLLDIASVKDEEVFVFNDSVYTYNFSLSFKDDIVKFKLISRDLDFDYSSIILLLIAFLVLIFLRSQNNKYLRAHKYKGKQDTSKI